MIRFCHVYFPSRTVLLVLSEATLVWLVYLAVTYLRFGRDAELMLLYERGLLKTAVAVLVCMLSMYYHDLYDSAVYNSGRATMTRLVQVFGTVCLILSLLYYGWEQLQAPRGVFVLWVAFAALALALWRKLFAELNRLTHLTQRAVLLGEGPLATALASEIHLRRELGVELLGFVGKKDSTVDGLPRLGATEELRGLVETRRIERVILTLGDRRGALPVEELLTLKTQGLLVEDGADVYEAVTGKVPVDSLRPSGLLFSHGFRVSRPILIYKRVLSLSGAILGLAVTMPVMLVIALAVWLDSRGPIIFRQQRVGKDGKNFTLYKFRSMHDGADRDGDPKPAQQHDRRVTRVGRFLRRARLDELPQLYNILRGDMYFIGPRPFTPNMEQELSRRIPFYSQRWAIKPGATGWAQIQQGYCATLEDNKEKLSYDLFYIKNISIGLDCLILFQTAKILLLGRGAR